jgi:hypothetical protein
LRCIPETFLLLKYEGKYVVVDAVARERLSGQQSLFCRERTGNFLVFGKEMRKCGSI